MDVAIEGGLVAGRTFGQTSDVTRVQLDNYETTSEVWIQEQNGDSYFWAADGEPVTDTQISEVEGYKNIDSTTYVGPQLQLPITATIQTGELKGTGLYILPGAGLRIDTKTQEVDPNLSFGVGISYEF